MKSSGNGTPQQCTANLLKTIRGEVPYERLKGIDPRLIDQPVTLASGKMQEDIEWVLRTYEPRVDLQGVDLDALAAKVGSFMIQANILESGAGEDNG